MRKATDRRGEPRVVESLCKLYELALAATHIKTPDDEEEPCALRFIDRHHVRVVTLSRLRRPAEGPVSVFGCTCQSARDSPASTGLCEPDRPSDERGSRMRVRAR